jgi:hypothetical protein
MSLRRRAWFIRKLSYSVRQAENDSVLIFLVLSYLRVYVPTMSREKKPIYRSAENTTLTISLTKRLKERIEEAAAEDRRKVSPWCVIQLERILDELEGAGKEPRAYPPMTMVAEEKNEGNGTEK